jgi:enterochelin esterase-like enzyme
MFTEETLIGPRLQALQRDIEAGNTTALEAFWQEVSKLGTPLIEPIAGDSKHSWVSFVWRAPDETATVSLAGQVERGDHRHVPMTRMPSTDLLYHTLRLRNDHRTEYRLGFGDGEGSERRDPLNPHTQLFPGGEDSFHGETDFTVSVLALPDAPLQPWLLPQPGVTPGRLEQHRFRSEILGNERILSIYTPAGYQREGEPYALVVLFDRWAYAEVMATPTVLDNLIAAGTIQPVVVVMISHIDFPARERELSCNPANAEFIATELIPWVRREYHITSDPARTVLGGSSAGGLAAAHAALLYPEMFGKVLSQSGAFWWKPVAEEEWEWLSRQFAGSPRAPLSFYLEAGLLESAPGEEDGMSLLGTNRRMRDVLQAKGYPVYYAEFNGPHVFACWQGSVADGLMALLGS